MEVYIFGSIEMLLIVLLPAHGLSTDFWHSVRKLASNKTSLHRDIILLNDCKDIYFKDSNAHIYRKKQSMRLVEVLALYLLRLFCLLLQKILQHHKVAFLVSLFTFHIKCLAY